VIEKYHATTENVLLQYTRIEPQMTRMTQID